MKAAEEACRAIERESVQEIKERTAELLQARQALVEEELGKVRRQGLQARQQQMEKARKNLGKASALIYGRIVANG